RDMSRRVAARAGRDEVPAGRGAQGPDDDQGDPRHAAHDPDHLRRQQPAGLLRAAGMDRGRGARAVLHPAAAQAQRRRHQPVPRSGRAAAAGAARAGGWVSAMADVEFFSKQWADAVRDALNAGPSEDVKSSKLQEYWDFFDFVRNIYPSSWALGCRDLPAELGGGP